MSDLMNCPRNGLIAVALSCLLLQTASAAPAQTRFHSEAGNFIVSCDAGPFAANYVAETASTVPLTSAYAVERGADKGLVRLMAEGGKRVKTYEIARDAIRATVRVKFDAEVPDRVDLVFTAENLTLVHTSTAGAGIFTDSDVYRLPYSRSGGVDNRSLDGDQDLRDMLRLGLSVYDIQHAQCAH